jgi:iron complex outermembrane receptor protein
MKKQGQFKLKSAHILGSTILGGLIMVHGGAYAAETAAAQDSGIEEIVVTARLRSENLQKVPVAVTAFSAKAIDDARIKGVSDFMSMTPNVSINQSESSGVSFITIRGVSQVRNGESPVAVVVDGVEQVSSRQFAQDLFDIEKIEVVRGPQGALYGRNAIGGAILITTRQPTNEFEASAGASYGRGDDYRVQGSVSGPIVADKLLFRASGSYRHFGGIYRNVYLDKTVDQVEDTNLRGQLKAIINENLTADLIISHGKTNGGALNFQYQSSNFDTNNPCFLDAGNPLAGPAPDADHVSRQFCATNRGEDHRTVDNISLKLDYKTDVATITNILAYNYVKEYVAGDQFPYTANVGLFGFLDGTQTQYETNKAWSDEFRITSSSANKFRWMVGAYYLNTKRFISTTTGLDNNQGILQVTDTPFFSSPVNPTTSFFADRNNNKAWALFANAAYDITDQLEGSFAIRYDKDHRDQFVLPDQTGSLPAGCSVATPDNCHKTRSYDLAQPKFTLRYQAMENLSLFGSWGVGFRSGQFNQSGVAAVAAGAGTNGVFDAVEKEEVRTLELGFKSQFANNRLRLNGTFYTTSDKNPLYFVFLGSIGAQVLVNVDKVRSTGFELEGQANLAKGLDAFANFGYTHSRIKAYGVNPADVGNWAPYVPATTWAAGLQYRTPVMDKLGLFLRGDVEHHGKQYWDPENTTARSGFNLVNFRAGFEDPEGKWSLIASLDNAFDKKYNSEWVLGGFAHPGQPRAWVVDAKFRF